ncbi:DUF3616 domain-containing protein [Thiosulfativibrio zosterae]|uniref:DUF3616 domain-containing protein n=1 Tax=Thiosulfativibrio zosterae TaxID=2675053 RepID=A0A6F8PQH3_9GAMM|nr:DUF3616 domain-containing protein [Thiosulfativibrio zosterae]BBP44278.1 hypothetical protein THMIRHAT_20240 [Thiosulfativibrio zosterae]
MLQRFLNIFALLFITSMAQAKVAQVIETLKLPNLDIPNEDISGIVIQPNFMALVSDEGNALQILKKTGSRWVAKTPIELSASKDEIDLEGLTYQAPYLYAIGSHSAKRPRIKDEASVEKNLKRLAEVLPERSRQQLFRIELDTQLNAKNIEAISIESIIQDHPILSRFIPIPSKENGIDIEGLSIDAEGRLLIGFRGPVIRGNLAPVLQLQLKKKRFDIKDSEVFWLNLNGRGIRGLSQVANQDRWLVLAGDVGDLETPYEVYLWTGDHQLNAMQSLCELPKSRGKPEGIQWTKQHGKVWEFVIVQDGLKNGEAQQFSCRE